MTRLKNSLIAILMFLVLPITVFAKTGIVLTANQNTMEVGEEIVVTASTSENAHLFALTATLNFDRNVFEEIDETAFEITNPNVSVSYSDTTNKFGILNKTGEISGELFKIHLKAKKEGNVGDTNIVLTNITSSDGTNKEVYEKASTQVLVTRDAKEGEEIPNNPVFDAEDREEIELKATSTFPVSFGITIAIGLLLLYILWLMKSKKPNKKKKILHSLSGVLVLLVALLVLFVITNRKTDINQDGETNYEDTKEIIKYLIDMEAEEEEKNTQLEGNTSSSKPNKTTTSSSKKENNKYDVNHDGKVDINDAGSSADDVTNKENYEVKLSEKETDYYVSKGMLDLEFYATVRPNEIIKEVKIDGTYYEVIKEGDYYKFSINCEEVGEHTFTITAVKLENTREVETKFTIKKEVLKDVPYVNQFNVHEEDNTFRFDLVDIDNAFVSGTATIYEGETAITTVDVQSSNSIHADLKLDKIYNVLIVGNYDLDSNRNNEFNAYTEEEMFAHSFIIGGDYNFTLTNISITDTIEKNEIPKLTFTSTNTRNATVEKVNLTIDNGEAKDYPITKRDGDSYEIDLDRVASGKHTVQINSVSLTTLKQFNNHEDFALPTFTYEVLKEAPQVSNISLKENSIFVDGKNDKNEDIKIEKKGVDVQFQIEDRDEAVSNLTIVVTDSTNKIIASQEMSKEEALTYSSKPIFLQFADKNSSNNNYGYFKVSFLADYTLGDKQIFNDKSIGEKELITETGVSITDIKFIELVPTYYGTEPREKSETGKFATKGEKPYYLQFYVNTEGLNTYTRLSAVTINGLNYTLNGGVKAIPDADDADNNRKKFQYVSYTAVTVPKESGVVVAKANRVQFEVNGYYAKQNDYYTVPEKTIQFEVLKDAPTIKNLEIVKEDASNHEVTFKFDVESIEDAFISGEVELNQVSQEIHKGENTVTFNDFVINQNYDLVFKATYDLDSGELDKEEKFNKKTEEIYRVSYGLYDASVYENIKVQEGIALSKQKSRYFEKLEPITLQFAITGLPKDLDLEPEKVVIDGKTYPLEKQKNGYEIQLDGFTTFGEKEVTITNIILNNGRNVLLSVPYTIRPVILKDIVKIEDYRYEVEEDSIRIHFAVKDYDASLIGRAKTIITDEEGNILYNGNDYDITLPKKENTLRYYISVSGNYDRDIDVTIDSDNYSKEVVLLNEIISLENNAIELKDINDVSLYKVSNEDGNEKILLMDQIEVSALQENLKDYFVEVSMENLPNVRARIKEALIENEHLLLVLEYESMINENRTDLDEFKIEYGPITEGEAKNISHPNTAFQALLDDLKANKDVVLTRDYDASAISVDTNYYVETYSGKLDGNGHTIKNLTRSFFNEITNGEVKNLTLRDVTLDGDDHGALAKVVDKSHIDHVIAIRVTKPTTYAKEGQNGGLIGVAKNSTIEYCGVKDVNLNGGGEQQAGGLIGNTENSKVLNCYAYGTVRGNHNYTGGLVANARNSEIMGSYVKVNLSGPISCDLACGYNALSTYKNNIVLGSGGNKGFSDNAKNPENNYYLSSTRDAKEGIQFISKEEVNKDLFLKAHFNENFWRLENVSYDNNPMFKTEKITDLYDVNHPDFDESKITLYNNLMKLMPYYDGEKILEMATKVTDTNLIHNEIVNLVPVDSQGHLVTYLTSDNVKKISKIKIIYKDKQKIEYDVTYDKTYDAIASYRIPALKLDYNYKNYILDANAQIVVNLTNYLSKLNYTDNLDTLTVNTDSRIYRDFYNETTKKDLKEFVLKFLSNSDYASTTNDSAINNYLEREVKKDRKIEKVLYMYNYFKRFYSLDINGIDLSDFMLFQFDDFDSSLKPLRIAEMFLQDGNNFNTGSTNNKYISLLSGYTHLSNIAKFLEYMVTGFSNQDMNSWVASQFKGYLVEIPVKDHPEVQYTLWDHFSHPDKGKGDTSYQVYDYILPILTLPENASYIISSPVQFVIGAQRSYIKDPNNSSEVDILHKRIASYASRMTDYFDTAYKILQDEDVFNAIHTYHLDKRFAYDENGAMVYQQQLVTEEPFHKNFNEVVGRWATSDGNAAVAWGDRIEWSAEGLMDGNIDPDLVGIVGPLQEYTYHTWSHESAHNIDARLFLRDYGRRFDAGGEDYADSNLMQSFGPNDIVMNLSVYYPNGSRIGSNLTPARINTPEKIHDYYNKVFQTIYVMDYIEAQAFLQLNDEDKAETGIQVSYPNEQYKEDEKSAYRAYQTTGFNQRDAKTWGEMNLQTIDDLIDHKVMLYPGVYLYSSRGSNSYGGEGLNTVHWYQPNNPFGRPDSYALKWNAYEMLGYAGYEKGYIEYNSNIHSIRKTIYKDVSKPSDGTSEVDYKTDLMALEKITGYQDYDTYKKERFKEVAEKLEYLNPAIDVKTYVQKFYDALVQDASRTRVEVPKKMQDNPSCLKDYWCTRSMAELRGYQYSTEVRQEIYYTLKELTDDFRTDIYESTPVQEIGDLTVQKNEPVENK